MKRIAWVTDIHLNFLPADACAAFLDELASLNLDGLIISGDIAESHDVAEYLVRIGEAVAGEVYFVLGNHDFYYGSVRGVRAAMDALCHRQPRLHYLSSAGPIELAPEVALVGHDGWADGRLGDYPRSLIFLHDYQLISELSLFGKAERRKVLEALGDEAAAHIRSVLPAALAEHRQVFLVTHVPPLRQPAGTKGRSPTTSGRPTSPARPSAMRSWRSCPSIPTANSPCSAATPMARARPGRCRTC